MTVESFPWALSSPARVVPNQDFSPKSGHETEYEDPEATCKASCQPGVSQLKEDDYGTHDPINMEEDDMNFNIEHLNSEDDIYRDNVVLYTCCQRGRRVGRLTIESYNETNATNYSTRGKNQVKDYGEFFIRGIVKGVDKAKESMIFVRSQDRQAFNQGRWAIATNYRTLVKVNMSLTGTTSCLIIEKGPETDDIRERNNWIWCWRIWAGDTVQVESFCQQTFQISARNNSARFNAFPAPWNISRIKDFSSEFFSFRTCLLDFLDH